MLSLKPIENKQYVHQCMSNRRTAQDKACRRFCATNCGILLLCRGALNNQSSLFEALLSVQNMYNLGQSGKLLSALFKKSECHTLRQFSKYSSKCTILLRQTLLRLTSAVLAARTMRCRMHAHSHLRLLLNCDSSWGGLLAKLSCYTQQAPGPISLSLLKTDSMSCNTDHLEARSD